MKECIKNKKMLLVAICTMLACIYTQADAQTQQLTGIVSGKDALPLPGATVQVAGTQKATVTDANGYFQFSLSANDKAVVITMTGYKAQRINVSPGQNIEIVLEEDVAELKDVVVIGYGTVSKKEVTGAVSVVKADDIKNMPVRSAADILQGKATGVTVSQSSGSPGSASVVRIRGIGSINNSTDPLYIIDGLPQPNMDFLNPNDIESIAVHKDASVAAIYGSRASNGVIIITTKSGAKNDKLTVTYDGYYGLQAPWKRPEMLSAAEFITYKNLAATNAGAPKLYDFSTQENIDSVLRFVKLNSGANGTDWWNETTQHHAPMQNHNISVSGGGKSVSFLSSLAYLDQKGIIDGSDFQRISWRNNLNAQVNERIKLSTNVGLIYDGRHTVDENNPFTGTIFSAIAGDPITPVYRTYLEELPTFLEGIQQGYEPNNEFSHYAGFLYSNKLNPVGQMYRMRQSKYETISIKGGITLDVKILRSLSFQTRAGMDVIRALNNGFVPKYSINSYDYSTYNTVTNSSFASNYFVSENTLNYSEGFGRFKVNALAGVSAEVTKVSLFNASIQGLPSNDPDMRILSAGTINPAVSGYPYSNSIQSLFGRIGVDYDSKYIIAANIRRDGSSRFAEGYRWGTFPSVSAAWRFSEENYFKDNFKGWLSEGKLHASYGVIGNQNISNGAYQNTYGTGIYDRYLFGSENTPAIGAGRISIGNPLLRWERSTQLDIGIDLSLFDNKLTFAADYFDKRVKDMLIIIPRPSTLGYPNSPFSNEGTMQNKGWEFQLGYNNADNAFKYNVTANISTYTNQVIHSGGVPTYMTSPRISESITATEEFKPVGYYYGYVTNGIFQNAKEVEGSAQRDVSVPGDIRFKDLNGDDVIDANDRTMIGNPWPDFVYGLTANFSYSNFDLSIFLQGSQGNDVINMQRFDTESGVGYYNAPKGFLERSWSGEGSTDRFHKISQIQGLNGLLSDYYVEDGSYLRLKNIQLGYNFSSTFLNTLKAKQLRIYVGVQNLFTLTKYSGLDPEMGSVDPKLTGIDSGFYPQARTFMTGVIVKF